MVRIRLTFRTIVFIWLILLTNRLGRRGLSWLRSVDRKARSAYLPAGARDAVEHSNQPGTNHRRAGLREIEECSSSKAGTTRMRIFSSSFRSKDGTS